MKAIDVLEETYAALSANKARSGLTMLGIVIGISSVIAMLAIGNGATSSITSSIQSIGSNLIMVTPGAQQGPGMMVSSGRGSAKTLTLEDAEALKTVASVKSVASEVSGRYQVTAKGQNTNTQIVGTVSIYAEVKNVQAEKGNFISDQNVTAASRVAVLGPTVAEDIFGTGVDPVGQTVRINKIDFKVIGVTKSKGSSGMNNSDDVIYVPISTAQRVLSGNKYVTTINVEAESSDSMTAVQEAVTALLLSRHHITDSTKADFSTMNQADILSTMSSVTSILSLLLGSVAGISLVVGGIGIMNMMLTTVTERTREIGLRKAIGAKGKDISIQFLIEAITLTFVGGFIGILLGWGIAVGITYFNLIQADVSLSSVLLAFGVSAAIGVVFGYYPARRAAKLNPIQALRFE